MLTDEASRDLAVVGVEETDHVVVAATSWVEVLQVLSGHGEPDNEDDSREGDAHHDNVKRVACPNRLSINKYLRTRRILNCSKASLKARWWDCDDLIYAALKRSSQKRSPE